MRSEMANLVPAGQVPTVAAVLLDSRLPQLDQLFDYAVTPEMAAQIKVGQRVKVPLRSQSRSSFGWVIRLATNTAYDGILQPVTQILGEPAVLTAEVWDLVNHCADRAAGNASDLLRFAIPPRHVRAEKAFLKEVSAAPSDDDSPPALRDVWESAVTPTSVIDEITAKLQAGSCLSFEVNHGMDQLPNSLWVQGWAATLALLAEREMREGRSIIICVPDYRDLNQLAAALRALVAARVTRVDAKQSKEDRYRAHLECLTEVPRVIIGNRAAVLAPAHNLGTIVIWDEADPLLQFPKAPYMHSRDIALVRQSQTGCAVLSAGYSRSVAIQRLVEIGIFETAANPPKRTTVRALESLPAERTGGRISSGVVVAIRAGLETGPVLIQVSKPGYALAGSCARCKTPARCANCTGPLSKTSLTAEISCLWCLETFTHWRCTECRGTQLQLRGAGSERTVEQLSVTFPGVPLVLSDGTHPVQLVSGDPAIVVATPGAEPVAAAGYATVVLLDAENMLQIPTLSISEDCLRWWENAAAKAREDGICYISRELGGVTEVFLRGTLIAWLRSELALRNSLRFPPAVRVASVEGTHTEVETALAKLTEFTAYDVLPPVKMSNGAWRAIVRFSYAIGAEVARTLRAAVVAAAAGRQGSRARPRTRAPELLRVRMDDQTVFDAYTRTVTEAPEELG
ncbi:hypothetical protein [Canibacter zhoujuaniae]|uniref:primosomal protein N' family DNA-binding protein n=1 Tax=Canibacter zhoujuaniae TaxID=2708343 RepID=UPI0014210F3D|nr:hypothetical protein [Canibacter zhoujuaniae]